MRKSCIALAAAADLALVLAACAGPDAPATTSPAATPGGTPLSPYPEAYVFQVRGTEVAIDQDMAEVLEALGEANSYFEAASCAFDGLDKTYTYSGFVITTRPDGDRDLVNSILLTDDSVATAEGIYIGSSQADVLAAYGDTEVAYNVIQYTLDNTTLNFILEGGTVLSIEYIPA